MNKKTVRDVALDGKRVLLRVDFNVPFDMKVKKITDDTRIREALPTIKYLLAHKARIIVCSHFGRPDGKVVEEMRLRPIGERLSELLGKRVFIAGDCIGKEVEKIVSQMKEGDIVLLENLRFHPEEELNDEGFARALARLADIFVNDAFGTTHRAHASTVGVTRFLPSVAGFLIEKELKNMGKALNSPSRPLGILIGGAKVSDKIGLLENIIKKVDILLIGGGMSCTFIKAKGYSVGNSTVEQSKLDFAKKLIADSIASNVHLLLPVDVVIAPKIDAAAETRIVDIDKVPDGWSIVDIGAKTVDIFSTELKRCGTVIWNGPMGIYEIPGFANGTFAMARLLASLKAVTVIGGGSTAEAVKDLGLASKMTHVSTGGGASLNFLEGMELPGIAALQDR